MIYLDNAATTMPLDEVLEKYMSVSKSAFGNSSSLHTVGLKAAEELERARERVADLLSCDSAEVYFTSGGTEGDNISVLGTANRLRRRGNRIVACGYEHSAVHGCLTALSEQGFEVIFVGTKNGRFDLEVLEAALDEKTILITCMYVNNETGLVNPVSKLRALRDRKAPAAYIHTDAVQAFGKLPCDVNMLGVDLLSCSSHKIGGVKGVGALYIRKGVTVKTPVYGGGHEKGIRSGTVNVPAAAAFGVACDLARRGLAENYSKIKDLRDYAAGKLDFVKIHAFDDVSPYVLSVCAEGFRGETLLHSLNGKDIYVATAAACSSHKSGDARVLTAQGYTKEEVGSTLRISFCPSNTMQEADCLISALKECMQTLSKGVR